MNLGVQFPEGLSGMFRGFATSDQLDMARQNNSINQQASLEDMMRRQEMHPVDMASKQASTGLVQQQTRGAKLKNDFDENTFDDRIKGELSKIATQISEDDFKQIDMAVQAGMMSQNPQERAIASQLNSMRRALVEMREKENLEHKNKLEQIGASGKIQKEVAGIYAANKGGGKGAGSSEAAMIAKMGFEKAAVFYDNKAMEAELEGDAEAAARFRAQANKMKEAFERGKTLAAGTAQGGKVDAGAATGLPTRAAPVPQGFTQPAAKPQAANLADVQKMYPGVPADKLKEAYKKKFGVDLQ